MSNEANEELIPNNNNQPNNNNAQMENIDVSFMILIKNPNNEIVLGYNTEAKLLNNDNLNVTDTEKQIIHQHYGTFNNHPHIRIPIDRFYAFKMEVLIIKYTVLVLSLFMIAFDINNIRNRIKSQEDIVSELYQIFWSFMVVYVLCFSLYCVLLLLSFYYDARDFLKYTFRVLVCTLIYQFIEIILRRYDLLLILIRMILIALMKKWIFLNTVIAYAISENPEYANITISRRDLSLINQA